jgi:hypothetical protein
MALRQRHAPHLAILLPQLLDPLGNLAAQLRGHGLAVDHVAVHEVAAL